MQMLPKDFLGLMLPFAVLFSKQVWQHVLVLIVGAILAPGKRTVSAILRVMGLDQEPHFQRYCQLNEKNPELSTIVPLRSRFV
jgi:hypothetical protein